MTGDRLPCLFVACRVARVEQALWTAPLNTVCLHKKAPSHPMLFYNFFYLMLLA